MAPKWRKMRIGVTIVMTAIGILLLILAWLSIGRVPGAAVVNLAFLALVLPFGFYGLFTIVGWHRSAGATPTGLTGWCIRQGMAPFLPIVFMFFLLGLMGNLIRALDHPANDPHEASEADSVAFNPVEMRSACMASLTRQLRSAGRDPNDSIVQARVGNYCSCLTSGVTANYTEAELATFMQDGSRAQDPKYKRIVQQCQAKRKI